MVIVWTTENLDEDQVLSLFEEKMGIRSRMIEIKTLAKIPRNSSGKVVYKELQEA